MNKAVLLDRDGVLNKEREAYNFQLEDFEILPDVAPALKLLREKGYLLIVISNQGGIGKGMFTVADVEKMHGKLNNYLKEHGLHLDEIYYCTHHPETGNCICRKPDSELVEKALARFDIDPAQSYFIGDKERDVMAGKKVGVEGILIPSNFSLLEAIQPILNRK
ncbi:MAG TPA: HAD family hydrolase [Bacteroidia bacterium]|jgi:D-glycero-D-manno-heptose 1,7-bisphosphate phosphatase|nr:HAD family hydrolase [Bacteroidia bacterium]